MVTIGTHDGQFHADEALAIYLLLQLPEYKSSKIIRTRDPKKLAQCDVVIDVGGEYQHQTKRYDHHQRTFEDTFSSDWKSSFEAEGVTSVDIPKFAEIRLSSAGLVYRHYGRAVLQQNIASHQSSVPLEWVYRHVYENLIASCDANDNGIHRYPESSLPLYKESTSLPHRVHTLYPRWNEMESEEETLQRFMEAVALTGRDFDACWKDFVLGQWPARSIVEKAMKERTRHEILVLPCSCPWKNYLLELEGGEKQVLYVIYPDRVDPKTFTAAADSSYRIQAVPVHATSFQSRLPLPEPWRGIRDQDLDSLLDQHGVPNGAVFVHASGFIGGHKTLQGCLKMAETALTLQ